MSITTGLLEQYVYGRAILSHSPGISTTDECHCRLLFRAYYICSAEATEQGVLFCSAEQGT
jgi:hypothetical protein